jgi:D-aspartate ligase
LRQGAVGDREASSQEARFKTNQDNPLVQATLANNQQYSEAKSASLVANVTTPVTMPVVVLKVGRLVLHHGSVGIIRSLGRLGVPVYGVVEDQLTPAAVSRYLTGAIIWELHGMDSESFLDGMEIIGEKLGKAVVIPTDDVGAILVAEHANILRRWFFFPELCASLPRTLANKRELYRLCENIQVPYPRSFFPSTGAEVSKFIERASFPIVIKLAESWAPPDGKCRRTTVVAWNAKQAYEFCRNAGDNLSPNIVFQEFISEERGEDWFYHGYRNGESKCSVGFTGRKLRSFPLYAGPTTLGRTADNPDLKHHAEALLEKINYSGIMDLDFRFDKRDGQYKLLDFNPRVGAQFRVFEDTAGVDVARAIYFDLTGNRIHNQLRPVKSRTFVAEFHDFASSFANFIQGKLSFKEWKGSLLGNRELAWFSHDDLMPFLMVCLRLPFTMLRKIFHLRFAPVMSSVRPRIAEGRRCKAFHKNQDFLQAHSS